MRKYYYDLHTHSCLSPCGDADNTPNNIAGIASLSGLNIVALTDHNSAKNCPAFFESAKRYGIVPVAGMELTTSEDIHIVCLFEHLSDAMDFDKEVESLRVLVKNKSKIFGEQLIVDSLDNVIAEEEHLLLNATKVSIVDVPDLVRKYNGVCYPAHIDRDSNGMIAILGTFPKTPFFKCFELHDPKNLSEYKSKYDLHDKIAIISSDAHYLGDINDGENYFEIDDEPYSSEFVRKKLFEILR